MRKFTILALEIIIIVLVIVLIWYAAKAPATAKLGEEEE